MVEKRTDGEEVNGSIVSYKNVVDTTISNAAIGNNDDVVGANVVD